MSQDVGGVTQKKGSHETYAAVLQAAPGLTARLTPWPRQSGCLDSQDSPPPSPPATVLDSRTHPPESTSLVVVGVSGAATVGLELRFAHFQATAST